MPLPFYRLFLSIHPSLPPIVSQSQPSAYLSRPPNAHLFYDRLLIVLSNEQVVLSLASFYVRWFEIWKYFIKLKFGNVGGFWFLMRSIIIEPNLLYNTCTLIYGWSFDAIEHSFCHEILFSSRSKSALRNKNIWMNYLSQFKIDNLCTTHAAYISVNI